MYINQWQLLEKRILMQRTPMNRYANSEDRFTSTRFCFRNFFDTFRDGTSVSVSTRNGKMNKIRGDRMITRESRVLNRNCIHDILMTPRG